VSRRALVLLAAAALLGACRQDMHDQPKYKPYRGSDFFGDARSDRPQVEDTVARGHLRDNDEMYVGKTGTAFASRFPMPVTAEVLKRGQQRFSIYCTPCHGQTGKGNGYVVQRGYRTPPSFHIDRLRAQPAGYFYDVITNGFGAMPDYSAQVDVADRWAIVAYVRALQLSENVKVTEIPAEEQARLQAEPAMPAASPAPAGGESH